MSNSSATFQRYHLVRHRPNASAAVTSLDPKQIHFLVGYFYPRLPDPGAFLERILSSTKMTRAPFSLYLEIGVPRMYSGILTVAEIRKGYEMKRGNSVSVHDIIIIIIRYGCLLSQVFSSRYFS
jgi:hypothetical protein